MIDIDFSSLEICDQNAHPFNFSSVKSRYLLIYFYPKDSTPGCTQQACKIAESWHELQSLDCSVIGVSRDSAIKHQRFISQYSLPFTLLTDADAQLCQLFGVWTQKTMFGKKYMGIERSSFLLNRERKIIQSWRKVKPKEHISLIMDYIRTL